MPTYDPATHAALHAFAGFFVFVWLFVCVMIAIAIMAYWRIASKAGYSGILSLLMVLPLVNIIVLLFFAFSDWPIEQEVRRLRAGGAAPPGTSVMPT